MKRVKVYVHREKESNYIMADHIGLTESARDGFRGLGYEIELVFDINEETGEGDLVGAGGFFLGDEPISDGEIEFDESDAGR